VSRTYAQHQPDLMPGALRGPYGLAWAKAQGTLKDELATRARQSVYLGGAVDPEGRGRQAPDDALARLGADAQLERSPIDTAATYRARIAAAWEVHGWAGTPYGYAYALSLTSAQIRGARFVAQYQWTPPDGLTSLWSRFWVLVWTGALTVGRFTVGPWATVGGQASPFSLLVVGDFVVGDGSTIGSDMTVAQLGEIRRALAKWKNARDRVPALKLASGSVVGTPGLVVGTFTVGGSVITYTLDLIVGAFVVGASPTEDPDGPWYPRVGRSNLV
jgi:hypothetical protein